MKFRLKKWLGLVIVSSLLITATVANDLPKDQKVKEISSATVAATVAIAPNDLPWAP